MTNQAIIKVFITLADDLHNFDTLELLFEPINETITLEEYIENPEDEFRYEILNKLRDTKMWKAGLSNPEGKPFKAELGTAIIDLETKTIQNIELEKTSHHSLKEHDLIPR
jgi:hypothetical protein